MCWVFVEGNCTECNKVIREAQRKRFLLHPYAICSCERYYPYRSKFLCLKLTGETSSLHQWKRSRRNSLAWLRPQTTRDHVPKLSVLIVCTSLNNPYAPKRHGTDSEKIFVTFLTRCRLPIITIIIKLSWEIWLLFRTFHSKFYLSPSFFLLIALSASVSCSLSQLRSLLCISSFCSHLLCSSSAVPPGSSS